MNNVANYLSDEEFRHHQNELMTDLDAHNRDMNNLLEDERQILNSYSNAFSMTNFVNNTRALLDKAAERTTTPSIYRDPSKSPSGVRKKIHKIAESPSNRLPSINVNMSSGRIRNALRRSKLVDQSPKTTEELVVITGKVNYNQLLNEQAQMKSRTEAADEQYRTLLKDFENVQDTIARRFSWLLKDSNNIITGFPVPRSDSETEYSNRRDEYI